MIPLQHIFWILIVAIAAGCSVRGAAIPGTIPITAPIAPTDTADTFPSHLSLYGKGGFRSVLDLSERDGIPTPRREAGMQVYVQSQRTIYVLGQNLTTWMEVRPRLTVDNFTALQNIVATNFPAGTIANTTGFATAGDGGEWAYYYNPFSTSTALPNAAAIGGGAWEIMGWNGSVAPFGANPRDVFDDTAAVVAAESYAFSQGGGANRPTPVLRFPPGEYLFTTITTRVSLLGEGGTATGYYNSEPVRFKQLSTATNDMIFAQSDNSGRGLTFRNIRFMGRDNAGPRRSTAITSVSSRTNFVVNPAQLPSFTGWAQKTVEPYFGWVGFWNTNGFYLGAGMVKTINTNTGAVVLEWGTDKYATRVGSGDLLEPNKVVCGFGDVVAVTDPQWGTTTGGSDARAGYAALVTVANKRSTIEGCSFMGWYTGIRMYMGDTTTIKNCEFSKCNLAPFMAPMPGFFHSSTDNKISDILVVGDWYDQTETDTWTPKAYRCTLMGLAISTALQYFDNYVCGPVVYGGVFGPQLMDNTLNRFRVEGPFSTPIWQLYVPNWPYGGSWTFDKFELSRREDWELPADRGDVTVIVAGNGTAYSQPITFDNISVGSMGRGPWSNEWRWASLHKVRNPSTISIKSLTDPLGLITNSIHTVSTPGVDGVNFARSMVNVPGGMTLSDQLMTLRLGGDTNGFQRTGKSKVSRVVANGQNNDFLAFSTFSDAGSSTVTLGGGSTLYRAANRISMNIGDTVDTFGGTLSLDLNPSRVEIYKPLRVNIGSVLGLQVEVPSTPFMNQTWMRLVYWDGSAYVSVPVARTNVAGIDGVLIAR